MVTHDPRLEKFATRVDRILDGRLTVNHGGDNGVGRAEQAAREGEATRGQEDLGSEAGPEGVRLGSGEMETVRSY